MGEVKKPRYAMVWARMVKLEDKDIKVDDKLVELAKKGESVISPNEKWRRKMLSYISACIFVIVLGLLFYFDVSKMYRVVLYLPILATYLFTMQSRNGLCGISMRGTWDPDGCGIRKIEDNDLREKLISKGKKFFRNSFIYAAILTIPFMLL